MFNYSDPMRPKLLALVASLALLTAGCGSSSELPSNLSGKTGHASSTHAAPSSPAATTTKAPVDVPARPGETFQTIQFNDAYQPSSPTLSGNDDYRCFLADPKVKTDQFVNGVTVTPGNPKLVHHVIIFKVDPSAVADAQAQDAAEDGPGWTCFGGTGLDRGPGGNLDKSAWIAGWAPGGAERVMAKDIGVPLAKGARVIVQVHYNLLAGEGTDTSTVRLRLSPAKGSDKKPLQTMLLPAPVELPCRPGVTSSLCDRTRAVGDIRARFDENPATADLIHLLCGDIKPGKVQSCTRTVREPATIRSVAGHMHLLGRAITIDINKGTPKARRVLDITNWDFDNQTGEVLKKPAALKVGDKLTVTCTHDQSLRDALPAFEGQKERYVAWGEGTTDEMCLGIVLLTRP